MPTTIRHPIAAHGSPVVPDDSQWSLMSGAYPGFQRGGCPIRKVGGGAVHFRSDIRKVGGGGGGNSLQVRYEKWGGGGGEQSTSGPIYEKWGGGGGGGKGKFSVAAAD